MIKQHTSARAFLKQVGPLLYQDEAANSLLLGLCESLKNAQPSATLAPLFLRVTSQDKTRTAALQTPPYNLILTRARDAHLRALVEHLANIGWQLPGLIGPPREVDVFAELWQARAGVKVRSTIDQRIYRLDQVTFPPPVKGKLRSAEASDARRLAKWLGEFAAEALPFEQRTFQQDLAQASAKIAQRQAFVWQAGRTAVSMAFITRPTKHGISIGPVYTPMCERKKGYASALVAALSQAMLASGRKFCVLYTDLANPTSNKIYTDIGYRPIADSRYVIFT